MGKQTRSWTPKYKEERQEPSNELSLGCGVAGTPGPLVPPQAPLPLFQVSTHPTFLESACLSHLHGHHPGPRTTILLLDSPVEVQLPPLAPVVHSLPSSQDGQTLPFPLNALQFEACSPVAVASEPAVAWAPSEALGVERGNNVVNKHHQFTD